MVVKRNLYGYLVVINDCEDEIYYFDNINKMFNFCEATSIKECIDYFTNCYSTVTIYRVADSYSNI